MNFNYFSFSTLATLVLAGLAAPYVKRVVDRTANQLNSTIEARIAQAHNTASTYISNTTNKVRSYLQAKRTQFTKKAHALFR